MTQIVKIKSAIPYTEYSAQWDISLGISQWDNVEAIDKIRNFCIDIEDEILALPSENDGGTGLKNRTTNKFESYNLFDYVDRCPELESLLDFFRNSYLNFVFNDHNSPRETYIRSWFNVLKKNDTIEEHAHGCKPIDYLSENMHLDDYDTQTYYIWPYDTVETGIKNQKGNLTIFPSYLMHRADTHLEDNLRVSIAFDLYVKDFANPDLLKSSTPFIELDKIK